MDSPGKWIALVAAVVLTLAPAAMGTAQGQEATPSSPDPAGDIGVVDAGSRSLWNPSDPTALVYQLTVLEFADPARATSSFELITNATSGFLAHNDATPDAVATTVAGLDETDVDLGDRAVLYYQPDESGAAGVATLFVLDGVYVHQWLALPVPLQENTLLIDPASLSDGLLTLARPWFGVGHDGDAIAQLPDLTQFPAGYEVLNETSGLDAIQSPASPVAVP